jgi:outer membrane lipoprotein SlyB
MNTPLTHKGSTHHPMMIIAAIAIVLFCLAGTAAIMGWIPSSVGGNTAAGRGDLTEADRIALASKMDAPAPAPLAYQQAQQQQPTQQLMAQPLPQQQPVRQYAPEPVVQRNANYNEPATNHNTNYREPVHVAAAAPAKNWCSNCGNVESIREIKSRAQGSGVGAAGGAILGGLLGNQVGGGHGRQLATVAGAVGGAVVGNQVEGNMKATTSYEIHVRLDDGSSRTFHQNSAPGWHTGDRVRVVKGALHSVR